MFSIVIQAYIEQLLRVNLSKNYLNNPYFLRTLNKILEKKCTLIIINRLFLTALTFIHSYYIISTFFVVDTRLYVSKNVSYNFILKV